MEKQEERVSPFAASSYREQQDRWLEWRSRQLDFQPAGEIRDEIPQEREIPVPSYSWPVMQQPAPTRHRELDKVWERHKQAAGRTGQFMPASNRF